MSKEQEQLRLEIAKICEPGFNAWCRFARCEEYSSDCSRCKTNEIMAILAERCWLKINPPTVGRYLFGGHDYNKSWRPVQPIEIEDSRIEKEGK